MATEVSLLSFHLLLLLRVSFYRLHHTSAASFIVDWALIGPSIGKILSLDEPFLFLCDSGAVIAPFQDFVGESVISSFAHSSETYFCCANVFT
jgi:hypothetical protein